MTPLPRSCAAHGFVVPTGARARRRPRRSFRKPGQPPAPAWMRYAVIGFAAGSAAALLFVAGAFNPLLRLLNWYGVTWEG